MFDIESNAESNARAGFTRFEMAGFYNGLVYKFCPTLSELVTVLLNDRNGGKVIYAHNGGRFDFLHVLEELCTRNVSAHLIVQGARITGISIRLASGKKISLQDSFAILPYSLDSLCKTFKPKHAKQTGKIDFSRERVDKENPEHRAYLEADCRALQEIMGRYKALPMLEGTRIGVTRSSTGLAAWRRTLKKPIRVTPPEIQDFVRKAYAGGRTEAFRMEVEGEELKRGDVNSLYPAMLLKDLPVEWEGETSDADDFGFHDVEVQVPECCIPVLWSKRDRLIFPTGIFRGVFFSEELKYARDKGVKILRHFKGHRFSRSRDLFREYVEALYRVRLENPEIEISPGVFEKHPFNVAAKDLLNHTYGKTAEREIKRRVMRVDLNDPSSWPESFEPVVSTEVFERYGFVQWEEEKRSPHMLCHIAAATTAQGRIHMHRTVYTPFENTLAYTDTDSGDFCGTHAGGTALGELKIEIPKIDWAIYLGPKAYFLGLPSGKIIRKLKGFNAEFLKRVTPELFRAREFEQKTKKLGTWRRSLQRNGRLVSMVYDKKSLKSPYTKRVLVGNSGKTRPWHFANGELK